MTRWRLNLAAGYNVLNNEVTDMSEESNNETSESMVDAICVVLLVAIAVCGAVYWVANQG